MPIKVFSAPGDHRDDFEVVEDQVNAWLHENEARLQDMMMDITPLPQSRDSKSFMMTIVIRYD